MTTRVDADISVQRFGYASDEAGHRLLFPHADCQRIEGRSGTVAYGGTEAVFEALEGRLGTLRWTAAAASLGGAWLGDDLGKFGVEVERVELPRGVMLTRAAHGVEVVAPHVSMSEMRVVVRGPFGRSGPEPVAPPVAPPGLRQDRLRFLDSLSGRVYLTVKVVLDLPVLKRRTLDQALKVPIQDGSLDFRALNDSLDWLEGAFIDISHDRDRLALQWKVPILGSARDLISWQLDQEAAMNASFGRVPLRSLADFRIGSGQPPRDDKRKTLQSLALDGIDVALSLLAPHSVEVGHGVIRFGGDDQPGMLDLKVTGNINDRGPGQVRGTIGSLDTTLSDLQLGPVQVSCDRMHFDGLDQLEVVFDGFRPTSVTMVIHRVTATNLALRIGGAHP